jgi:hypothetical protein
VISHADGKAPIPLGGEEEKRKTKGEKESKSNEKVELGASSCGGECQCR